MSEINHNLGVVDLKNRRRKHGEHCFMTIQGQCSAEVFLNNSSLADMKSMPALSKYSKLNRAGIKVKNTHSLAYA